MILVNLPLPTQCIKCPVRSECALYKLWLTDLGLEPKPLQQPCLIIGEVSEVKIDVAGKEEIYASPKSKGWFSLWKNRKSL